MGKIIKISTSKMGHDEWLANRRRGIGGSDASTIVGLNHYSSQYQLWAEKLGKLPPLEDNETMRQGRDLEDYVAKRFCEAAGKKVKRDNHIIYNSDYPFALANVDRMVIGENAGLECKTTSVLNLKKFKNGEYPANYYVQCMHYMMVTGAEGWYLAVLILGKEFKWFYIPRDDEEIAVLAKAEKDFWDLVQNRQEPPIDGLKATTDTIKEIYNSSDDIACDLTPCDTEIKKYIELKEQESNVKYLLDEQANKIKNYMKNSQIGVSDVAKISWKSQSRQTFDTKKYKKDNPQLDLSAYYKTSDSRPFKVNILGGKN